MMQDYVPATVPMAGKVINTILQMTTFGVLCVVITRRAQHIAKWKALPLAMWLILIIYVDSTLFVFVTAIIVNGFGINSSRGVCEGGIILCLVCYMSTKILIYYFLVERAYIVRGSIKPRRKTRLWLFNCIFMLLPYTIFVIMNFIWRITYIDDNGVCIIGMQKKAMLPLITFEVVVNVYLTLLFVLPLRNLYSYKNKQNMALHRMAFRSLVSSIATLTTSIANLTILMVLHGEPGWICLMCCNADILFCVLVLHWVTSKERQGTTASSSSPAATAESKSSPSSKRRESFAKLESQETITCKDDTITSSHIHSISINDWTHDPTVVNEPPEALKLPSTVATECKGGSKRPSSRVYSSLMLHMKKAGAKEDWSESTMELHKIHVSTIQTVQVEVDAEAENQSAKGEPREWSRSASMEKTL